MKTVISDSKPCGVVREICEIEQNGGKKSGEQNGGFTKPCAGRYRRDRIQNASPILAVAAIVLGIYAPWTELTKTVLHNMPLSWGSRAFSAP
jgi:hypothetical protein